MFLFAFGVVRRLMPFTALKHLIPVPFKVDDGGRCAPPNAVYGIETLKPIRPHIRTHSSCAPPNAVYGIETREPYYLALTTIFPLCAA